MAGKVGNNQRASGGQRARAARGQGSGSYGASSSTTPTPASGQAAGEGSSSPTNREADQYVTGESPANTDPNASTSQEQYVPNPGSEGALATPAPDTPASPEEHSRARQHGLLYRDKLGRPGESGRYGDHRRGLATRRRLGHRVGLPRGLASPRILPDGGLDNCLFPVADSIARLHPSFALQHQAPGLRVLTRAGPGSPPREQPTNEMIIRTKC
jgi:hypothetical protein